MVGQGLRTNASGAAQVVSTLAELDVTCLVVDLPHSSMHLMGEVRFLDRDLAFARPGRTPWTALEALREHGYEVRFFPDTDEMVYGFGHNFVTLGPRKVLMPEGCPITQQAYEDAGVECVTVDLGEIHKCAGGIGCLSGVITRDGLAGR
jgi:N-dimethylarginine dimethylaminohydrolase